MRSWINLLKNSLTRGLPADCVIKEEQKSYGRIRDNLKYVYPSAIKYWKLGVLSGISLLFSSLLAYPQPMINRYLIDEVLQKKQIHLVLPVILLMVAIYVSSFAIGQLRQYCSTRFNQKFILDIQEKLITKVLSLPKLFFDKTSTGYIMSRITGDVGGLQWFIGGPIIQVSTELFKLIGGIAFLWYLEWRIALLIVITLPIPIFLNRFFSRRSYIMNHYWSEFGARFSSTFQEIIASVPLIKTFSMESRSVKQIVDQIKTNNSISNEQMFVGAFNSTIMRALPTLIRGIILICGAYWVINGHWKLGTLVAYQQYLGYVYGPIGSLAGVVNQLQHARASLDRIAALFKMAPEDNVDTGIQIGKLKGRVAFKNVAFSYEKDKPVLKNLSFDAMPGEHYAVIGTSGIGKTTLVNLILRLYKPETGEIFFDGLNALEYNVRALRRRIGYVAQNTCLLSGTILDNIKYGNSDATLDEVILATKAAEIHDFIDGLPNKYDTALLERAGNLSEGQKQRISIARAIVKKPDILIMDEPTSALDNITEQSIYHALPKYVQGKTTFTIAHRLSTIKGADKIILLLDDHTPIIGTHLELMQSNKKYQEFFASNND